MVSLHQTKKEDQQLSYKALSRRRNSSQKGIRWSGYQTMFSLPKGRWQCWHRWSKLNTVHCVHCMTSLIMCKQYIVAVICYACTNKWACLMFTVKLLPLAPKYFLQNFNGTPHLLVRLDTVASSSGTICVLEWVFLNDSQTFSSRQCYDSYTLLFIHVCADGILGSASVRLVYSC